MHARVVRPACDKAFVRTAKRGAKDKPCSERLGTDKFCNSAALIDIVALEDATTARSVQEQVRLRRRARRVAMQSGAARCGLRDKVGLTLWRGACVATCEARDWDAKHLFAPTLLDHEPVDVLDTASDAIRDGVGRPCRNAARRRIVA